MATTYFKRFRMEIDLRGREIPLPQLPDDCCFVAWHSSLVDRHAQVKYESFRTEIDSGVFPCLGDPVGCHRLMNEIAGRTGFLAEATWLVASRGDDGSEDCGTIQGLRDHAGLGAIQNIGVVPAHRGRGLGTALLLQTLAGFQFAGLRKAYLEVTAQNAGAIRLYKRYGFRKMRTVYKAVEMVSEFSW